MLTFHFTTNSMFVCVFVALLCFIYPLHPLCRRSSSPVYDRSGGPASAGRDYILIARVLKCAAARNRPHAAGLVYLVVVVRLTFSLSMLTTQ